MLGSVLATVNESLTTPRLAAQASMTFHANPVMRLTSVAIAIEPLALASEGCAPRAVLTVLDCVPPLRVNCHLALRSVLGPGARRAHPAEKADHHQEHEDPARDPGDGDRDGADRGRGRLQPRGAAELGAAPGGERGVHGE